MKLQLATDSEFVIVTDNSAAEDGQHHAFGWIVRATNTDTTGPAPGPTHRIDAYVYCLKFVQ
jgi:hypothetical protein